MPRSEHKGETGTAWWQTIQFEGLRVRLVEYSNGYVADHWCTKGHIVHCLDGEFISELQDGSKRALTKGMTYIVSDDLSSHRSSTDVGVKLSKFRSYNICESKLVISIVLLSITENGGFNNTSLRKRFGMHDKQAAQISKLIKDAIDSAK